MQVHAKSDALKLCWTGFYIYTAVSENLKFLCVLLVCLHLFALRSLEK